METNQLEVYFQGENFIPLIHVSDFVDILKKGLFGSKEEFK